MARRKLPRRMSPEQRKHRLTLNTKMLVKATRDLDVPNGLLLSASRQATRRSLLVKKGTFGVICGGFRRKDGVRMIAFEREGFGAQGFVVGDFRPDAFKRFRHVDVM